MGTLRKFKCIDDKGVDGLTSGKIYHGHFTSNGEYVQPEYNDNGSTVSVYFSNRFEEVPVAYDADKVEVRFGGVLLKGEDLDDRVTAKRAKLRYSLIPADVLEMLAKVFDFGAKKHDEDEGWKSLDPQLYEDALMRHLQEVRKGNLIDPESGLPHRAHVLCNAAMILWHELNGKK